MAVIVKTARETHYNIKRLQEGEKAVDKLTPQ
jgi:hypothetical protein